MRRYLSYLVIALALAEVVLVFVSWLLSATMAEGVHSLLSSGGLRWFFGNFSSLLASSWLVWLVLAAMTGGVLWQSGLVVLRLPLSANQYRQRVALRVAVIVLIIYMLAVAALSMVPHAVLLSATGRLFPSPFSRALVPIVLFGVLLVSAVYGLASGSFKSLADVVDSLATGVAKAAPLFPLYVVSVQLYESFRFVFGCL